MPEQTPTDSHSPVNWRVRRNTGVADTLHVSTVNGAVRLGTRGIRLIIARDTALTLADHIVDAVEQLDQSHVCAHSFQEQLERAIAATTDEELR